jgi:PAS domain S-box-containing protein
VRELKHGGYEPTFERVETAEAMNAALDKQTWDVIIADYVMPHFSGLGALKILQERGLNIPFIIVSGGIGEEIAVEAMKAGAYDYLMKGNLKRLVPAIERELREAVVRREQKEKEKALRETKQTLEAVVETATSLTVLTDSDGKIILFNRACEELTGYKRNEVIGKTIPELFLPAEWIPIVQKRFADLYSPEVRAPHENPWITKSGEERLIEWRCTVLPSSKDGKPCILGTGIDITERKRAEEALLESEKKYKNLVDNALVGIYKTNLKGDILYVNDALTKILEFQSKEEMMAESVLVRYKNPKDRDILIENLKKMVRVESFETELLTKTKKVKDVLLSALLDKDVISGMTIDITERKRAEEEIKKRVKELEEFYQMAIGRELKMIELKKEIERLKEELGRYKK